MRDCAIFDCRLSIGQEVGATIRCSVTPIDDVAVGGTRRPNAVRTCRIEQVGRR